MQLLIKFDLRSSLVGYVLNTTLKTVKIIKSDHRFDYSPKTLKKKMYIYI